VYNPTGILAALRVSKRPARVKKIELFTELGYWIFAFENRKIPEFRLPRHWLGGKIYRVKKYVVAFTFTFLFSYFLFAAYTGLLLPSGAGVATQGVDFYLLLASGPLLLALANVAYLLITQSEDARNVNEFGSEIVASGALLIQVARILTYPIFFPLWLVILVYTGAEFYLFQSAALIGLNLVLLAQFFWFLWRRKLFRFSDSPVVSVSLYTPLRIFLRMVDVLSGLIVLSMIGVIGQYAYIPEPVWLMLISLVLAFGLLAWNRGGLKEVLQMNLPLLLAPLFLWITVVITVLNFSLDISGPIQKSEVSYADCPGAHDRLISVSGNRIQGPLPAQQYYGCQLLGKYSNADIHTKITISHYRGGIGIGWLQLEKK
jgi:hypothetical protein